MVVKPPYKLFIDSGAFIALFNKKDYYHDNAIEYYNNLTKETTLITTMLVVSETYTWFRYHVNHKTAIEFLDVILDSSKSKWLDVIYPKRDLDTHAMAILRKLHDQKLSYVDAVSFATIESLKIKDVFTFDSHFHIQKLNIWPMGF